jgi:hypothetical protein
VVRSVIKDLQFDRDVSYRDGVAKFFRLILNIVTYLHARVEHGCF